MHCRVIRDEPGGVTFLCGPARTRGRLLCGVCGARPQVRLCDGPKAGGKTCDLPLCEQCAIHVSEQVDFCPDCAPAEYAALAQRIRARNAALARKPR